VPPLTRADPTEHLREDCELSHDRFCLSLTSPSVAALIEQHDRITRFATSAR